MKRLGASLGAQASQQAETSAWLTRISLKVSKQTAEGPVAAEHPADWSAAFALLHPAKQL
jgi:hypothetical protein